MAERAGRELRNGFYVKLGIRFPRCGQPHSAERPRHIGRLTLKELAPGVTLDAVRTKTQAKIEDGSFSQ
jgi:acyl CoA:acetate/3-ketoacid CoA transferase beta subunit